MNSHEQNVKACNDRCDLKYVRKLYFNITTIAVIITVLTSAVGIVWAAASWKTAIEYKLDDTLQQKDKIDSLYIWQQRELRAR